MRRFIQIILVLGGVIAAHSASAQPFDMEVYRAIEPKLKASFEKQVGPLKQVYDAHLAEFKKTNTAGNWADHLDYDEWIKMMIHNQTNMAMSCAADQKVSADDIRNEAANFKAAFVPCFVRRSTAMNMFFKIDNLFITFNVGKFTKECDAKARLASRESLPVYEFLKSSNVSAPRLYNFGAYLSCIFDVMGVPPSKFHIDPRALEQ